jgi:hypothetical protein
MEAKRQPQWDCRRGLRHTTKRAPCQPGDKGKFDITTTIPSKVLFINDLRELYWVSYKTGKKFDVGYRLRIQESRVFNF